MGSSISKTSIRRTTCCGRSTCGAFGISSAGESNGVALRGNRLLVTDYNGDLVLTDDVIYSIDRPSGALVGVWHVDGPLNPNPSASIDQILGIEIDASNRIWVSDLNQQLHEIELLAGGNWNRISVTGTHGGDDWFGLDHDTCRGEFFVTNFSLNRHQHHDLLPNPPLATFPHAAANATGITSNRAGLLFTCGFSQDIIYEHEGPECGVSAIYDIDFGTPPHTVGLPPATGSGPVPRHVVSAVTMGDPLVVPVSGPLVYQPLEFNSAGGADQIRLALNDLALSCFYSVDCDMYVGASSTSSFIVYLDAPTFRRVDFTSSSNVTIQIAGGATQTVGTYPRGAAFRFLTEADLRNDTWRVAVDGGVLYEGTFGGATSISTIRFSTPTGTSNVVAAIDNVVVRALPDIEVESFGAPATASPGVPIGDRISLSIFNRGPVHVWQGFSVGFYISADPTITTGDQLLTGGREFVPQILAGEIRDVPLTPEAVIPPGWPLGPAYLGALVDEFNIIPECEETDNAVAAPVNVIPPIAVQSEPAPPLVLALNAPAPNPLAPATRLSYDLPEPAVVTLTVFDAQGRSIATLVDGRKPAGSHAVTWNGRSNSGARLAAGTYFLRLTADGVERTQKLIITE